MKVPCLLLRPIAEMEKYGCIGRAACANFSQLCYFLFCFHAFKKKRFLAFFVQIRPFLLILHDFGHFFAHILCANFSGLKFCVCKLFPSDPLSASESYILM